MKKEKRLEGWARLTEIIAYFLLLSFFILHLFEVLGAI
jgi:hypothetical protein